MDEPAPGRLTHRGVPVDRELRILALGQLANRFGSGAVMTTSAVYFTRVVGLTAAQVALAMAVSTAIGLSGQLPAGRLAVADSVVLTLPINGPIHSIPA